MDELKEKQLLIQMHYPSIELNFILRGTLSLLLPRSIIQSSR